MKFIHTADWHIGNLFHEFDRTREHEAFLKFLVDTLRRTETDVLLISGDIYDVANPSAAAMKLFNSFLSRAMELNPALQIVIIAGNHDSPGRLEVVKPLVDPNVHIVGLVDRLPDGSIDYQNLIIPLHQNGVIKGYCLAVPFLRLGDYPTIGECSNPYSQGVQAFYHEIYEEALRHRTNKEFIIALGHLHTQNAEISDHDDNERAIMGGVETISVDSFPAGVAYIALGHIHKAQRIAGCDHIRYSGSPLPMSFSETNYKHQLLQFKIHEGKAVELESIEIPTFRGLLQVPAKHAPLPTVIDALRNLPDSAKDDGELPYLQVRVLLESPEPGLRHQVEEALNGKAVQLAKIDVRYPNSDDDNRNGHAASPGQLQHLKPFDIFSSMYKAKYKDAVPDTLSNLFHQAAEQVHQQD